MPLSQSQALALIKERVRTLPGKPGFLPPDDSHTWAPLFTSSPGDVVERAFRDYFGATGTKIILEGRRWLQDPQVTTFEPLASLPPGIVLPKNTSWGNGDLFFSGVMSAAEKSALDALSADTSYRKAVAGLQKKSNATAGLLLDRVFAADLIWLFYHERMGLLRILGAILDDYASLGRYPISNTDPAAAIAQQVVNRTRMGLSSTVRDRDGAYRRSLGWTSEAGRKLGSSAAVNTAFNDLFHRFIQAALTYYREKRLVDNIRRTIGSATAPEPTAGGTLASVADTVSSLKQSMHAFDYGDNHQDAATGILWVVVALTLIRDLRQSLGVPASYTRESEYISAAYNLIFLGKRDHSPSDAERFTQHRTCAENGRSIVLGVQGVDETDLAPGEELDSWLSAIEPQVEAYSRAYQKLTGVDLSVSATPVVEQAA